MIIGLIVQMVLDKQQVGGYGMDIWIKGRFMCFFYIMLDRGQYSVGRVYEFFFDLYVYVIIINLLFIQYYLYCQIYCYGSICVLMIIVYLLMVLNNQNSDKR